ncbi:MAG TPA: cytochrome c3 family protein [Dissulfurispiraceae bacterium]|nr:cytochrome c3 family protein [Dissulfurispiraceae bacterium]
MKYFSALLVVIIAVAFVGSAMAVPSGKTVEFAGGGNGKVVFSGKAHADAGLHCNDCHTKIFPMKKTEGVFKMAEMKDGKACGACHNGTKAFGTDAANCSKCHKK